MLKNRFLGDGKAVVPRITYPSREKNMRILCLCAAIFAGLLISQEGQAVEAVKSEAFAIECDIKDAQSPAG